MGFFSGIGKVVKSASGIFKDVSPIINGIGGIAGIYGGLKGISDQQGAIRESNAQNVALSRDQMAWQERMRASQYQTAVGDLKAAGLNPMLAYSQGGAGNLSGSVARVEPTSNPSTNKGLVTAQIANSAASTQSLLSQTEKTQAEADATRAQEHMTNVNAASAAFDLELKQAMRDRFGLVETMGAELSTRSVKALYEGAKADQDFVTVKALNELATKSGYSSFDEAVSHRDFLKMLQDYDIGGQELKGMRQGYRLQGLSENQLKAMSRMWGSDYGSNIAPYLNSAGSAGDIIGGAVGTYKRLFPGKPGIVLPRRK
ncbi:MAG: DNA pilot protein [Microviridae sp.]|nr:MAG: DNA pilot protein [Microviridae sp.]